MIRKLTFFVLSLLLPYLQAEFCIYALSTWHYHFMNKIKTNTTIHFQFSDEKNYPILPLTLVKLPSLLTYAIFTLY